MVQFVMVDENNVSAGTVGFPDSLFPKSEKTTKNYLLQFYCKIGSVLGATIAMERGADGYDLGLYNACWGGHRDLVDLMITKGAKKWFLGRYGACKGGHNELINMMIGMGATACSHCGDGYEFNTFMDY